MNRRISGKTVVRVTLITVDSTLSVKLPMRIWDVTWRSMSQDKKLWCYEYVRLDWCGHRCYFIDSGNNGCVTIDAELKVDDPGATFDDFDAHISLRHRFDTSADKIMIPLDWAEPISLHILGWRWIWQSLSRLCLFLPRMIFGVSGRQPPVGMGLSLREIFTIHQGASCTIVPHKAPDMDRSGRSSLAACRSRCRVSDLPAPSCWRVESL